MEANLTLSLLQDKKTNEFKLIIFCSNNIKDYIIESIKEMFYIDYLKSCNIDISEDGTMISLIISDYKKVEVISKNMSINKLKKLGLDKICSN
jgi:hypothetical protein